MMFLVPNGRQTGSITLWIIVMLVMFAVMLSASLAFITRQSHATIIQEQEGQAFAAAESGVQHVVWLLNSDQQTLTSLKTLQVADQAVTNASGEVLARFDLNFSGIDTTGATVLSIGRDENLPDVCQAVQARVAKTATSGFSITSWEHLITYQCLHAATPSANVASPVSTTITLGNNLAPRQLSTTEPVHYYTFTATVGTQFRIKVKGNGFTPKLTLRDQDGVEVATAGYEYRLASIRFAGLLLDLQENLRTSLIGGTTSTAGCNKAIYLACIPWDMKNDQAWKEAPSTGNYSLEVSSTTTKLGTYQLETDKK